jgi:GMP synthase (glutamine-hydrolysing)
VSFEYPGSIVKWAAGNNYTTSFSNLSEPEIFPPLDSFDMLVIMGGPMGVYEEEKYRWLKKEKLFIRTAMDSGKKILGVCLGSQLLAEVLGAKVYPHHQKEIGWWPVQKVNSHPLTKPLPDELTGFHLHGDTFDLPKGAVQLFKTVGCEQQGFIYGNNVAALQFHPEIEKELLAGMMEHEKEETERSAYVQSTKEIMQQADLFLPQQKKWMYQFLDNLLTYKSY